MTALIRAVGGNKLTKTISRDGISPFDDAYLFEMHNHEPASFTELVEFVRLAETDPHSAIIRGEALVEGRAVRRLLRDQPDGSPATIRPVETGLSWVMLDIDKAPAPPGLATNEERLAYLRTLLPEPFRNATTYYQWSSSAGVVDWDLLSAHFFFWLDRPHSCASLHKRALSGDWRNCVDPAPFTPNQIHYVAAPVFIDLDDHLAGQRSGILRGEHETVLLEPWVEPYRPRPVVSAAARERMKSGSAFEAKLDEIGSPHYHLPILTAIAHYVSVTAEPDRDYCIDRIQECIIGSGRRYITSSYLRRIYRDAERKFGRA